MHIRFSHPFDAVTTTDIMSNANNGNLYTTYVEEMAKTDVRCIFIDCIALDGSKLSFEEGRDVYCLDCQLKRKKTSASCPSADVTA